MRNDILLTWKYEGAVLDSHFRLCEFEGEDGLVVVDSGLVRSLEHVRRELCAFYRHEVQIVIKSGTRTEAENERLAEKHGWVENGGKVARDSRHLPRYGGIAVDVRAQYRKGGVLVHIEQATLGSACRAHFAFVKDDYPDGHVHADNRTAL
jgi:hypothetical protein